MAKNLFVGGLPYAMTTDDLQKLFEKAGAVLSANIIVDRETRRSKGFGFVEMETDEDAQKAIDMLNGRDIEGRKIVVNEARPRESAGR